MIKKITAVLPTIGRINYLDIAIESMLNQSVPFDEIIVFDNSINQNLQDLSIFGNSKLIKFIKSGKQLNAIDSWNTAVESTINEYVTIMGDDDILLSNYCENIHKVLEYSNVGILKAYSIDENGDKKEKLVYPTKEFLTDEEFRTLRFFNKLSLFIPGMVFKKELFLKVGGFKNTYINGLAYSDELLLSQLSILTKNISISKDFCWNYRVHSEQIGGVKDISTYVDGVMQYLELYEKSLSQLYADKNEFYSQYTKKDYVAKVCKYGINLYGKYSSKNENIFTFLLNLIRYFIFDKRVPLKDRIHIILSSTKIFFCTHEIVKIIKKDKIND